MSLIYHNFNYELKQNADLNHQVGVLCNVELSGNNATLLLRLILLRTLGHFRRQPCLHFGMSLIEFGFLLSG